MLLPRRLLRPGITTLATLALGCHTIPEGRLAVDDVTVRGASKIDEGEITDKIATTENPRFLGLVTGFLYEYSLFDRNVLQRDLARVEEFYKSKGFYDAHARAGRILPVDEKHLRVEIVVDEGAPVVVRTVRVLGTEHVTVAISALAESAASDLLVHGKPFEEEAFDKSEDAVRRVFTDRGYAYAKVEKSAVVDIVEHQVDVVLTVSPGEPQVFGPVTLEGLGSLPDKPVRRAVNIDPGDPYSEAEIEAARQAVLDLGVFAAVEILPTLSTPPRPDHVVPITVKLEPARLHTVRLGGGIEFDELRTDIHGVAGWQSRNFFGGLRSFSAQVSPGVVLYPLRVNNIVAPDKLLPEAKARVEFKQPGFPEARTNLFIRPDLTVQALLLDTNPPPGARVIGYAETHGAVGLERSYGKLYAAVSQNGQYDYPFAYVGTRDPTLGPVVISYPELVTQLDFRDNRTHPRKGIWLGNTFQIAGGPFGGDADDLKIQPDVRAYAPIARGVVFAVRASVGFLWARNYGGIVQDPNGTVESAVDETRDYQLTFFRGFFSGGPSSNRGYAVRAIGPHANVPFISPAQEIQRLTNACTANDCRSPTGGFTLWEASTELRIKVNGPLSIATFCDSSDVSPRENDIRLSHLHLSCGAGGRYDTPVGPIRLDIGYRLPGLQVLGGLTSDERPPDSLIGIPIALSLAIGEAY